MMDRMGQEIAFKGIDTSEPYVPCFSMGPGQLCKVNFGQVGTNGQIELDGTQTMNISMLCSNTHVSYTL